MPRIRCNYEGCIHLEGGLCTADAIELDQELGCLTFTQVDEPEVEGLEDEWEGVLRGRRGRRRGGRVVIDVPSTSPERGVPIGLGSAD
jgi:hypothetical protein